MKNLTSSEQFDAMITDKKSFILFKHSTTCSISGAAYKEVSHAIDALALQEIYLLDVLQCPDLKMYIADTLGIKHESPQIIIFHAGEAVADASHRSITQAWIKEKLENLSIIKQ